MRPYFAIFIDSFREAFSSRILWFLLILTTIFLLALLPMSFAETEGGGAVFGYFTWEADGEMGGSKKIFLDNSVTLFVDYVLGVFGVFTAILVTASVIPKTFEAGSVDLLLSKPVSRPLLFLTKFFGGCAFIAMLSSYLVLGIWLIAGLRWDYWFDKLPLCIPLLLFVFAIYYSVSAVVGLIWKNVVMCIVMTIVFWVICFAVGKSKSFMEVLSIMPDQVVSIKPIGDAVLTQSASNEVKAWNRETQQWDHLHFGPVKSFGPLGMFIGRQENVPIYDPVGDRILALRKPDQNQVQIDQPGPPRADSSKGSTEKNGPRLFIGQASDNWRMEEGPLIPANNPAGQGGLFVHNGTVIVTGTNGIFKLVVGDKKNNSDNKDDKKIDGDQTKDRATNKDTKDNNGPFEKIGQPNFSTASLSAMDPTTGNLVFYDGKVLQAYRADQDGNYQQYQSVKLALRMLQASKGSDLSSPIVVFSAGTLGVGFADGSVVIFDSESLEVVSDVSCDEDSPLSDLRISPDGKHLAAVFRNRNMWLYDVAKQEELPIRISENGDISAITFVDDEKIAIASDSFDISIYDIQSQQREESFPPELSTPKKWYRYFIRPIHTIFPKPGEIGNMITYLIFGSKNIEQGRGQSIKIDIWTPIWSNLLFLSIVLAFGCFYVYRKDF